MEEPLYVTPQDIELAFEAEGSDYDTDHYQDIRASVRQYVDRVYRHVTVNQLADMMGLDAVFLLKKVIPRGSRKYIGKGCIIPTVTITYKESDV